MNGTAVANRCPVPSLCSLAFRAWMFAWALHERVGAPTALEGPRFDPAGAGKLRRCVNASMNRNEGAPYLTLRLSVGARRRFHTLLCSPLRVLGASAVTFRNPRADARGFEAVFTLFSLLAFSATPSQPHFVGRGFSMMSTRPRSMYCPPPVWWQCTAMTFSPERRAARPSASSSTSA